MQIKIALALVLCLLATCLLSGATAADATPTPLLVTNGDDDGPGSLRAAICDAASGSTIAFAFAGVISLTSGELLIDKNLAISGPGSAVVTVRRDPGAIHFRVVEVIAGVSVNLSDLTLSGGYDEVLGGGILNHGFLTMSQVRVTDT